MRGCACRGTAGFAHVSCLAEQVKILWAEVEENNLDGERAQSRWDQWHACSLCEQKYHGAVKCALGWACWKTYLGRLERDHSHIMAINLLGNGLAAAEHHEDAMSVQEAELSMLRRLGMAEVHILSSQNNLARTYEAVGRLEESIQMKRDVYFGRLRLNGEEHLETLKAAVNYANALLNLKRFEEAKALLRKSVPTARRVLGENHEATLKMRHLYAQLLCRDEGATLDDFREAVRTLAETERTARRVFGGAHPLVVEMEKDLRYARAALAARVGDDVSSVCEGVAAMTAKGA